MIAPDPGFEFPRVTALEFLAPAFAAAASVVILARFASPLGLLDEGGGAGLHRAPSGRRLVLVGGLALGIGLALAAWLASSPSAQLSSALSAPWPGVAMFTALAIGLADDTARSGLSARSKSALQMLPALAFALGNDTPLAWLPALAFAAALAAQNLANTFDNADGVLLATAAAALAPARPVWSAILLAVLVFNLRWRGPARVLLGDSGSHLIALMLCCEPRAWGAFVVPALDLVRVALVRRSQARAWWLGDRTHLAHRLEARGLRPLAVALTLVLAGLPAILAVACFEGALARTLGIAASAIAFLLAVRATPAVDGHGAPIKETRSDSPLASADRAR
ncbi:MAG TPA: hypothetical protein VK843_04160 [Planctomycetota bacterium]|nr:hypothetical protein [Planctomycetota bacterium]